MHGHMIRCTEMALNMLRTRLENLKVLGLEAGVTQGLHSQWYFIAMMHFSQFSANNLHLCGRVLQRFFSFCEVQPLQLTVQGR